jgi:hypothetical protein
MEVGTYQLHAPEFRADFITKVPRDFTFGDGSDDLLKPTLQVPLQSRVRMERLYLRRPYDKATEKLPDLFG